MYYRRNSDESYRETLRRFQAEPTLENYALAISAARRTGQALPDAPLARWEAIVDAWEYSTWDATVEGGYSSRATGLDPEEITPEEARRISSLDYYGKPVETAHALSLFNGEPYGRSSGTPFAVIYSGIDGNDTTGFDSFEEAAVYVNDRLPDRLYETISGDSFRTDFAVYQLSGFTFLDIYNLGPILTGPEGEDIDNVLHNLNYIPEGPRWSPAPDYDDYGY